MEALGERWVPWPAEPHPSACACRTEPRKDISAGLVIAVATDGTKDLNIGLARRHILTVKKERGVVTRQKLDISRTDEHGSYLPFFEEGT